jgi:ubiquinone/menaquinone biosynthesis C-methylase UbiE
LTLQQQQRNERRDYLGRLGRLFDLDSFLKQDIGVEAVRDYYTRCAWIYRLLHSPDGALHLALNPDGAYDRAGMTVQPRLVEREIEKVGAKKVLELASGMGFNLNYLGPRHPDVTFTGMDLTPLHVALARKQTGRRLPNVSFCVGDYEELNFDDRGFDLVFAIECLCHARDLSVVLDEAFRVLRPGGRFVVTDGFRRPGFDDLPHDLKLAAQLVELSMSVERFWQIDRFVAAARTAGFRVLEVCDVSQAVLPNLKRLQRVARGYLRFPAVARFLTRVLPRHLVRHAVTGLLGALTLEHGAQGYNTLVLERPGNANIGVLAAGT